MADEGNEDLRCFVGGLPWSYQEEDLRQAFEKFGRIVDVKVVFDRETGRSRGFGFVTFSEKKDMEDAVAEMHESDLGGRNISVCKAQPRGSRPARGGYENRGGYRRSGPYDRPRDSSYGDDRDRGYGDRDRGYGDRDRGYGDRDRGYGDRDRGYGGDRAYPAPE